MSKISLWYNSYKEKLLSIALNKGYSKDEAGDIIQQFFLALLQKKVGIREDIENEEAYIIAAFKKRLIDIFRHKQRGEKHTEFQLHFDETVASALEQIEKVEIERELIDKIAIAYKKLPPRCRKVIYLKYYKGLTTETIVTETGLSYQTVYNNLSKGIQYLRIELQKNVSDTSTFNLSAILPFIF